ncbi:PaaI family thioesterase [Streptomyces sp. AN091965]|uniref:PaaI family thioesterase n=1 Tax=Streptomyces sp. AN091965 TaxID=2927803 RepID=UPI001F624182|nr:PaaI family thioesterase [Streptomyces sp. AN091965]MCI3933930.1 PaaI family thioesterase [Streptomyces sp. AN091965]
MPMTAQPDPRGPRVRTHTWEPPVPWAEAGDVSGPELLRKILAGELPEPPLGSTLDYRLVGYGEGTAVFEIDPGEHLLNPMGTVHGGVLATLLDSALGCAVATLLPPGRAYTTTQLSVNFVRPVFADSPRLRCDATALHVGRTTATAEARVVSSADGKLHAHATTTCAVFAAPRPEGAAS